MSLRTLTSTVLFCLAAQTVAVGQYAQQAPQAQEKLYILGGVRDLHQAASYTVNNVGDVDFSGEETFVGGLEFLTHDSQFGLEVGAFYSNSRTRGTLGLNRVDVDLTMFEMTVGGRYTMEEFGDLKPFVGGGADFIFYETDVDRNSFSTSLDRYDFGLYAHTGAHYHFDEEFSIGFDVRGLFGTADNLDYVQYAAVVGFSF